MKFLITGASGQLGREWARHLQEKNCEFVAFTSAEMDIRQPEVVERKLETVRPEIIINCAAFTNVDGAEDDPESAMKINRDGVETLARWCAKHRSVLVHFSTDYVFPGKREDLVRYPAGYSEEAETAPVNRYGESKLAGEKVLQDSGADFLLLRVSWLCGRYGSNFVKTMIRLGEEKGRVEVVKDQLGSPTFADVVAPVVMKLLDQSETGIFHLSSAGLISWFDLAEEIFRLSGISADVKPVMSSEFSSKAARPSFSKLNASKISRTLGIGTEDWQTGLNRLLQELKQDL